MTQISKTYTRRWLGALALAGLTLASGPLLAQTAPRVKFTTNLGSFEVEVYPDKAPKTVANFLQYVKDKFYDGTVFHRVIDGFMVQGGGFDAKMSEKPTRSPIVNEARDGIAKGLKNEVGYLAMARTNDPNSATAQFFINVKDNAFLDATVIPPGDPVPEFTYQGQTYKNLPRAKLLEAPTLVGYAVFGKVVSGMDVVNKIKSAPTGNQAGMQNVPLTPVVIQSAILEK